MNSLDIFNRDYAYKTMDFDQVLLDEATSSSFSVMESALSRRLWEPPPDGSCLKSESFSVSGSMPNGISWKVDTTFNFTTKNYEMTATGTYRKLVSIFKKRIKVLDVSDYLLFSDGTSPINLYRLYNEKFPSSLIARDRRIYTKGPVTLGGNINRGNNPQLNWNGSASLWPGEYGTIIQGDRIQFGGGLSYGSYVIPQPNPDPTSNIVSLLAPYSNAWGTPDTYFSQFGAGSAVITKDYNIAQQLNDQVIAGTNGPLSRSQISANVYPIALFGGTPPLQAWTAGDGGSYFNNPDLYSIFYYAYAGANQFGIRMDATCISLADGKKLCSNSEHFPNGFKKWRKDASLEGYLFTSDAEAIPAPNLNWDNLEALEEDANACGKVISGPTNAYEDCPVWDRNFMTQYASTGSSLTCPQVSTVDMENVSLNNFSAAPLTDPNLQSRLLRRVIYLKKPTEIKQSSAQGLMVGSLPVDAARKNLSIWIVSEDLLALRGFQNDTTSPLTVDPGRLREVDFNFDGTGGGMQPLSMVVVSPEQIHLLSPGYKPMDSTHFKTYWPSSGGAIHPINHNLTDAYRYESDGFKYGYRRFNISNLSFITSAKVDASNPFVMRGLWSGPDSSATQFPSNFCMISMAGQILAPHGTDAMAETAMVPSYNSAANSPIPPLGSSYYNGKNYFPRRYYPDVFWTQIANGNPNRLESDLMLSGIRIHINFDNSVPPGKRDLSSPLYIPMESRYVADGMFDISHKIFTYDLPYYYQTKPQGTSCIYQNVAFLAPTAATGLYDKPGVWPSVNNGRYIFVQSAPSLDYRNIGSIVGVDQPVIETRNTK